MGKSIVSFNLGQIDKQYWKRFDNEDENYYSRASQDLTNFVLNSSGYLERRKGTLQFSDLTSIIAGRADIAFFIRDIYLQDQARVRVYCVRVATDLYLTTNPLAGFSHLTLDEFTEVQIQSAFFGVLRSELVVCHPRVPTVRITYDGTTFTKSDFVFSVQACFDDDSIDYSQVEVVITIPTTAGDPTIITLTPDVFGASAPLFKGGYITGPGNDPYSPFGTGTIIDMTVATGVTTLTVDTNTIFASKTASSKCLGSQLSIQRRIINATDGQMAFVKVFNNRAWWGGHPYTPQTIFGTVLGTENNLDLGIGDPTDAIVYTNSIEGVGNILYFNVGHQFEVYCEKSLLTVYQNFQGGLTPTTFSLKNQSQNSPVSPTCAPVAYGSYSFYSGKGNSTVYTLNQNQNGDENTYTADLASKYAKSLVPDAKKLVPFTGADGSTLMLAVLNDGGNVSLFMLNENNEIAGWFPFKFTTDFTIVDIDSDGYDLYLLVKYNLSNKYVLEVLDFSSDFYVDHAIPVSLPASPIPESIGGLATLNNCNIYVASDSLAMGTFKVLDGAITIPSLTRSLNLFAGVDSGINFRSMYLYTDPSAAYNFKSLNRLFVDYTNSLALTVNGFAIPFDQTQNPLTLQDGTFEINNGTGYNRFSTATISQYAPVKCEIVSLYYELDLGYR